jgi:hypothetical protein
MLPAKVPNARILMYNYESRWHADAPKTRLQLCGEELVHSVHSFRRDASRRPVVFVGHSLGGNVIVHVSWSARHAVPELTSNVEGLLYAAVEEKFQYLPNVTAGLVFLGTPFRGTKWQPFLDSLARIMQLARSHRGITGELGFEEPVLLDKLHRFCRLCNSLSMPVSCFSELYETDYGRRFGVGGVVRGTVCENRPHLERTLTSLGSRGGIRLDPRPRSIRPSDRSLKDQ